MEIIEWSEGMPNIAILGYGVVGSGLVELIERNKERLWTKHEKDINISKILVRDKKKHFKKRYSELLTNNIEEVFKESIDVVVEVMGGIHPAYEYVKRALKSQKHVVTANKDLIAEHGKELLDLAGENGVGIHFEASVGGGIPILKSLVECLVGNEIKEIRAILNGTTNFILTKMYRDNMGYDGALKLAQELGFAETKPEADVLGYDAARKLSILSTIAYNQRVNWKNINIEGITNVREEDFDFARKLDCNIKLIGISRVENHKVYASVEPMLVSNSSPLGSVENEYNAIIVNGDAVGEVVFSGKGAGMLPTASAVFSDVVDAIKNKKQTFFFNSRIADINKNWELSGEWMLRFRTANSISLINKLHEAFSSCITEVHKEEENIKVIVALVKAQSEAKLLDTIKIIEKDETTTIIAKIRKHDK